MSSIINILYKKIGKKQFNDWIAAHNPQHQIYASIDIRHSGYKVAPVDVNNFPAGFKYLSPENKSAAAKIIAESYQNKKFLILPENHNRNLHYNDNLLSLKQIFEMSGNQAIIAHKHQITSTQGDVIPTASVIKKSSLVTTTDGYTADIILVNNDMITGIPDELLDINQEIIPNPILGWYNRRKSTFFNIYNEVVRKFCNDFDIDDWLISTFTHQCENIKFNKREGLECIALTVEKMIGRIQSKYQEYSIKEKPYIFIKANNGSYGMGIMTAFSIEDVLSFNKDTRKKMNVTKGKAVVTDVLLQEGIPSIDSCAGNIAEPLIYCILGQPIAFLHRYHETQDKFNNLNKRGAQFKALECDEKYKSVLFYISTLSLLANSIELEHYSEKN